MFKRIFFASSGRANLIRSHEFWITGKNNPDEVSLTFSGQMESFISEAGAHGMMVSECMDGRTLTEGKMRIEHWPGKPMRGGIAYHWDELRKTWRLLKAARKFKADLAILDSGAMPFYQMWLFRWAGIPVIIALHNTIWPHGFRPTGGMRGLQLKLDGTFYKSGADAVVGVSPECSRQIDELVPGHRCYVTELRAQFEPDYFATIPPPPAWDGSTFNMMFIGRVDRAKGVLDIAEMARIVEAKLPGRVKWTICGRGPDLEALRAEVANGLQDVVDVRGWVSLEDLAEVYAKTHASIVPTRSTFAEGLAMTAAEAVLAGRPVVTNPVVPAHEIISEAVILGRTNDPASHAEAVIKLATDRALYEKLQGATAGMAAEFYDRSKGLAAVMHRTAEAIARP